ncbi:MAG: ABC transporter permease [Promethearchaeota archaeon]
MIEPTLKEELIEKVEEKKTLSGLKEILHWIGTNLKFLFIPGYVSQDLEKKRIEYEKQVSKRKFIRRLKSVLTLVGIVLIFVIITFAVFPEWLSMYTYDELTAYPWGQWDPPSPAHPLGQTKDGRDILGRMIWGARSSITIALPAILFSVIMGIIVGMVAGYFGGWVDSVLMRLMDILLAFPGIILLLVFISILGAHVEFFILAYGILGVAGYSRLIRGTVLQAKNLPYVEAAKVAGSGHLRIMFKHILPNTFQPVLISFTFDIGGIILSLAGLSFLGYGDPSMIEWGYDIAISRSNMYSAPWSMFWPGFMILLTVLAFMLMGDGLRDALDPRMKNL